MTRRRTWLMGAVGLSAQGISNSQIYYPKPAYLPEGYRHISQWTDRPDGFGGGQQEIANFYVNPTYAKGFSNALMIFVSPFPKRAFSFTEQRMPEKIDLRMKSGLTVTAEYWDGWWTPKPDGELVYNNARLSWDRSNVHALVFRLGENTIGVRACRLGGVTFQELVRVASSIQ